DTNASTVEACDLDANRCTHVQQDEAGTPCAGASPFACGPRCLTACVAGRCADVPATCDDDNPCTADACDASLGCTHTPQDGVGVAGCDDGQQCNGAEQCVGGVCERTPTFGCDDGLLCTDDSCTDAGGCAHLE